MSDCAQTPPPQGTSYVVKFAHGSNVAPSSKYLGPSESRITNLRINNMSRDPTGMPTPHLIP